MNLQRSVAAISELGRPHGEAPVSSPKGMARAASADALDLLCANPIQQYWVDAWQRAVLTSDVLRQRGNN